MTRFPLIHTLLTGETAGAETPPLQRRGAPNHGPNLKSGTQDMVVALVKNSKKPAASYAKPVPVSEADQLKAWIARGEREVFSVTTLLTPNLAALLTQRNDGNRPVLWKGANRSVAAYSAAMQRGEWRLNGESIVVSRCGFLNDGQHRCYAVLDSQVSVQVQITFGVERDTRHTVDQGIARSPGHILAMAGEQNTNQLATALQMLWCLDAGETLNARPSTDQLQETLARHPQIRDAITATSRLFGRYRLSAGYIAGAHYLCRREREFDADQFLGAVTTGLNIRNANSPVARLRKQYEEHSAKRKHLHRDEQAALYIKGFNNFIRGRTGPLAWRNTGPSTEAFPTVGG